MIEVEPAEVVPITAITVNDCDPVTQTFVIQVDLYTDFPPIFVNGMPLAGFTFISDPMPSGTYFAFEFTDNNPCSLPNFVDGTQTCLCLTEGGSMGSNILYGCPGSVISGDYLGGAVLDGNDQQVFVLHTSPGATLGTPLKISSTPEVEYDAALMSFGTTYYLSSVVGNASGGQIDWNDVCLAVSPGQPILFYPEPEVSIPTPSALSCFQPQVTLSGSVSGGSPSLEIKWLQGTQEIGAGVSLDVQSPGNYTLQAEDLLTGCIGLATVEVTGNPEGPTDMTLEETPPLCFGQNDGTLVIADVIGGTAPYQYQIDDLPLSDQAVFQGLSAGPHSIEVIDAAGCSLSQAINWDLPLELTIDPGPNLEVPLGTLVEIKPIYNFTPQQVNWLVNGEPDSGLTLQFEAFENATLTILAIAESGCTAQAALSIQVFEDAGVYLPNIFSPNADGQNDRFFPQGGSQIARIVDWRIFDRWGNPVYEQAEMLPGDKSKGWDGTVAGKPCPVGVYAYMLTVEYQNGDKEMVKGGVTLVR
ncbi:MAG: gliding motility-associated C-terminal domain-containing protein [Saprospirales bacterium]|nr:gliding motility-associated C-terminal domain-containing protein [Saprospirales bacterium]